MAIVQRDISGLNPNTSYVIKVRSVNGLGIASGWSESVIVTTPQLSASSGVLIRDQTNGHIYRIISTNGLLGLVLES